MPSNYIGVICYYLGRTNKRERAFIKIFIILICLLLLITSLPGRRTKIGNQVELPAGDWSISGIHINDNYEDVVQVLGEPVRENNIRGIQRYFFRWPEITLVVDELGRIQSVIGASLMRDGVEVLVLGQSGEAVEDTFGPGYRVRFYSDTTTGVFTTGSVLSSTTHYYRHEDTRFNVHVYRDGRINAFQAESMQMAELSQPEILIDREKVPVWERLWGWLLAF
jgi:hypothetical protein